MEKFVLWIGSHSERDFEAAKKVLNRKEDEIKEFHQFGFASLLTFHLPDNIIKRVDIGSITVIQIGNFKPTDGWEKRVESINNEDHHFQYFNGNGLAFILNKEKKDVVIILEPWGRRIAYYSTSVSSVIISNEIKAIIALNRSIASMENIDEASLATLIGLHQCFGTRTLFKDITLFNSGSIARVSEENLTPTILNKYQYHSNYRQDKSFNGFNDEFSRALREIMITEVQSNDMRGLFLSGGMDSGLLVCALPKEQRQQLRCVNFGNEKILDVIRAKTLIELIGGTHCFYKILPKHIMGENAYRHIWLVEGQSPSGVAFIESVIAHEPGGMITGNPGDFNLGGTWADKLTRYSGSKGDLKQMVGNMMMRPEFMLLLLGKTKGKKYLELIEQSILEAVSLEESENQKLTLERFVLKNRVLRSTNFGNIPVLEHKPILEPYFTDEIISATLATPIHYRSDRKLQAAIISTLSPEASELTWLQEKAQKFSLKKLIIDLAKKIPVVRSIGRKLLYRRLAAQFEDSYVPINTWVREVSEYTEFIKELLLSTRTQSRGIFNYKGVSKLLNQHLSGQVNHMSKLINLADLEILFRLFIDGDGFENPPQFNQNMDPPIITSFSGKTAK